MTQTHLHCSVTRSVVIRVRKKREHSYNILI